MKNFNSKIFELSHNVCSVHTKYNIGDLVSWLDEPYVITGIDLSKNPKPRYILTDIDDHHLIVDEFEIFPFVQVGDHVDIGFYPVKGTVNTWQVRKIRDNRIFVFNSYIRGGIGFWCDLENVIDVIRPTSQLPF